MMQLTQRGAFIFTTVLLFHLCMGFHFILAPNMALLAAAAALSIGSRKDLQLSEVLLMGCIPKWTDSLFDVC